MAFRGARTLILMSRSAQSTTHQTSRKIFLESGARVHVPSCDVADKASLQKAVSDCRRLRPIAGLIQAAAVLQDTLFENLALENWQRAVIPKVQGSRNLDMLFRDENLHFFILSSLTAMIGNVGQTNTPLGSLP